MKPSKFANMPPRPTKGQLVKAAKEQHKLNEAKTATPLPPVDESKFETKLVELATVDKGEITAADIEVLKAAVAGDQQGAADAIVANLTNDPAAGNEPVGVPQATTEQPSAPAAESPKEVKPPKGTESGLYALGKRYSPKTDRNSETWGKICKALADGPKTMKELAEAVKGHGDFLGYMTRGGHIVPHKVEEKVSG